MPRFSSRAALLFLFSSPNNHTEEFSKTNSVSAGNGLNVGELFPQGMEDPHSEVKATIPLHQMCSSHFHLSKATGKVSHIVSQGCPTFPPSQSWCDRKKTRRNSRTEHKKGCHISSILQYKLWKKEIQEGMLVTGQAANLTDLAKKLGMAAPYVTRILGLSNLAPDIVEAVRNGSEPEGVFLARLVKGFPDDWDEQRMVMLFQASLLPFQS